MLSRQGGALNRTYGRSPLRGEPSISLWDELQDVMSAQGCDRSRVLQGGARRVEQEGFGVDAAELRRLDEAVEEGGDLGVAPRARPVVVPPAEDSSVSATSEPDGEEFLHLADEVEA